MKRLVLVLAGLSGAVLLGACGAGEVAVEAQLENQTAEGTAVVVALRELPVRLLPYDRDVIFDSLAAAHPTPEPRISEELIQLQDSIAEAQAEWQRAEAAWNSVRDELKSLVDRMEGLSRGSSQYVVLFREFQALEPRERDYKRRMDQAFARFDQLQKRYTAQTEELRLARQQWADEAFAAVDSVIALRLEELGREEIADTTDANGTVRIKADPGKWWVYARYELPYQELYWNIPVDVQRGDPVVIRLTRETAEIRPKL